VSAELVPVRCVLFILNYRNSFLGNLVLHQAFERICVGRQYADIPRGLFVIRGENVLLIGELDFHQPIRVPLVEVTIEEILKLQKEDIEKKERIEKLRQKAMVEHGLVDDGNPIEEHY
jgi:U6 snRNA-associated Sm-like protein LSm1